MGKYVMDMSKEGKGKLLKKGWRRFEIIDCRKSISRAGNEQFIITMSDCETYQTIDVYVLAVEGKRWFLRNILQACQIPSENDKYTWGEADILGKIIDGRVENITEKFVNQFGQEKEGTNSKVIEVRIPDAVKETDDNIPF